MEPTASKVGACSFRTLAPADTSRLPTCNAAAISAWLVPPLASITRIFLFFDMGIEPLSVTAPLIGRTIRNCRREAGGTNSVYLGGTRSVDCRYQDLMIVGTNRVYQPSPDGSWSGELENSSKALNCIPAYARPQAYRQKAAGCVRLRNYVPKLTNGSWYSGVLCKLTFLAAPVLWRATCKLQFFGFARLLRMGFEQLLRRNYRFLKFARWSMISCFE